MENDTLDLTLTLGDLPAILAVEIIDEQTVKLHGVTADSLVAHWPALRDGPLRDLVAEHVAEARAVEENDRYHLHDYDLNR